MLKTDWHKNMCLLITTPQC